MKLKNLDNCYASYVQSLTDATEKNVSVLRETYLPFLKQKLQNLVEYVDPLVDIYIEYGLEVALIFEFVHIFLQIFRINITIS